jgi:hypothetical protein
MMIAAVTAIPMKMVGAITVAITVTITVAATVAATVEEVMVAQKATATMETRMAIPTVIHPQVVLALYGQASMAASLLGRHLEHLLVYWLLCYKRQFYVCCH